MDKLITIMENLVPGVNYLTCNNLISDGIFDSFAFLSLVSEIEEEFEIELSPSDLVPENFNSVQEIWGLIEKYKK